MMILIATLVKKKQYGKDNTKQKNMLIFTAFFNQSEKIIEFTTLLVKVTRKTKQKTNIRRESL